jgi:ADP-ribose pyrophosphatase
MIGFPPSGVSLNFDFQKTTKAAGDGIDEEVALKQFFTGRLSMIKPQQPNGTEIEPPDGVEIENKETVYDGYFKVDKYTLKHRQFEGSWSGGFTREVFERGHAVAVLLYDADLDQVVLIEQFRIGAYAARNYHHWDDNHSPWLIEVVAGMVEEGEKLEDVARREAVEEANCAIKELVPVTHYLASPGGTSETMAIFCGQIDASNAGGVHGLDHEDEDIRVISVPTSEVLMMLDQGKINNAMTLIALQWFRLNHKSLRTKWRS